MEENMKDKLKGLFGGNDETEETKWIPINDLNKYIWCNGQLSNIHAVRFYIEAYLAGTPF